MDSDQMEAAVQNRDEQQASADSSPPPTYNDAEATRGLTRFLQRRRMIVDPALQYPIIRTSLTLFAFSGLVIAGALFTPVLVTLRTTVPTDRLDIDAAAITLLHLHSQFWWAALLALVVVLLGTIRLSHTIAGPLVRVRRVLRLTAQGIIPGGFSTRGGDLMQEDVRLVNELNESLHRKISELKAAADALTEHAATCRRITSDRDPELDQAINAVVQDAERIATGVERFVLRD